MKRLRVAVGVALLGTATCAATPKRSRSRFSRYGHARAGQRDGKTIVTVLFGSTPGKPAAHVVSGPIRYVTKGDVVSSPAGLEFLSLPIWAD